MIKDDFLDGLPEFLARAVLKYLFRYAFSRPRDEDVPVELKPKERYMLPRDNQVRGRRHAASQNISAGQANSVYGNVDGLDGQAADENVMRPTKRRELWRSSSV